MAHKIGKITLFIAVFCLVASFASAEVLYKDGNARIQSTTHNLKDIKDTDYLEIKDNICYLKKPIVVASNGTLKVTSISCALVNMYDTSMITVYGKIYFENVKVTSYDPETGEPIELSRENYTTVRPDIVTRASAQYFSAKNSEFSYLGYYNPTSSHWGVALRFLPKAYIDNSKFHHNYFGFYTFDSDNVTIKNSESYDNLEYGINIHDFSDNFYAYNNVVHGNGNHGIILSKYNENGKLILNKVYDHTQNAFVKGLEKTYGTHGIMLHKQSNNALLSRNELTNNRVGIKLDDINDSSIKSNKVFSDQEQGFFIDESSNNEFKYNKVFESDKEPLFSFNSFYNYYESNNWGDADDIVYVKIEHDDGTVDRYKFPASGADAKLNELSTPPGATETTGTETVSIETSIETTNIETTDTESVSINSISINSVPIKSSIESVSEVVEDLNEDLEVDVARDKKLGIKNKKRSKDEEKAYLEKIKNYEKELAKNLLTEVKDLKKEKEKPRHPDMVVQQKAISEKAEIVITVEDNHEIVEVDKKRDAKLGIKATQKNKEQEKAYVNKIAKYEKEIAKEIIS